MRARAGGVCEACGGLIGLAGGVLDHRIPFGEGGTTDEANLWLLCERCDEEKTSADLARMRAARE